jgi:3-hydroxybutyryl-CoA dehydratase
MTAAWRPFPKVTHEISQDSINAYAEMSGDFNPLHVDPEYAATGPFGTIIAHGPIALQTVFEATARWLDVERIPSGVLIDAAFRGPARVGDSIRCSGTEPIDHAGVLTVQVSCVNQHSEPVIEALVVAPRQLVPRAG